MFNYQELHQHHRLHWQVYPIVKSKDILEHENCGRTNVTARRGMVNLRKTVGFLPNGQSSKLRSMKSKTSYEWQSFHLGVEHPLEFIPQIWIYIKFYCLSVSRRSVWRQWASVESTLYMHKNVARPSEHNVLELYRSIDFNACAVDLFYCFNFNQLIHKYISQHYILYNIHPCMFRHFCVILREFKKFCSPLNYISS
jgi:hypothetical protein